MGPSPEALATVRSNIQSRWKASDAQVASIMLAAGSVQAGVIAMLGVSLGLGALFEDNPDAESAWVNASIEDLGGTPIDVMGSGPEGIARVRRLLDLIRGL